MGLKLTSIEIEGFTGIHKPLKIDFTSNLVLISGENGSGKTSILRAIEFALYGTLNEMKGSQYSRNRDEIKNKFTTHQTKIQLTLNENNDDSLIERVKGKNPVGDLTMFSRKGNSYPVPLDDSLEVWLQMDDTDFNYLIYLTQSNFQQILDLTPKNRSDAFTRLFGVQPVNDVVNEINEFYKKLTNQLKRLESDRNTKQNLVNGLEEALKRINTEMTDELNSLEVESLKELEELTLSKSVADKIFTDQPSDLIELEKSLRENQKELVEKNRSTKGSKNSKILHLEMLSGYLANWADNVAQLNGKLEDQATFENRHPELEGAESKIESLSDKIKEITDEIMKINSFISFLQLALDEIIELSDELCPICQKPDFKKSQIKAEVTNRLATMETGDSDTLNSLKTEAERELLDLQDLLNEQRGKLEEIDKAKKSINDELKILLEKLKKEARLDKFTAFLETIELHLPDIEHIDDTLQDAASQIEDLLNEYKSSVDDGSEDFDILGKIINLLEDLDEIKSIRNLKDKQIQKQEDLNIGRRELDIIMASTTKATKNVYVGKELTKFIVDCEMEYIQSSIEKVNPALKLLLNKLKPHSYWDTLELLLKQKKSRTGTTTSYEIATSSSDDEDPVNLRAYFSRGQANRAILALLIALGSSTSSRFGFQLLDDVTQSLDDEGTQLLADACIELSDKTQFVLATADQRFKQYILDKAEEKSKIIQHIELGTWSKSGVLIS